MNNKLYDALKQLPLTKEQRVELQDTIVEVINDATKIPTIDSTYDKLNINDLFETNEKPNEDNIRVIDKNKSKELTKAILKTLNIDIDYNNNLLNFRNFNKKTIPPIIHINENILFISHVDFMQDFSTTLVIFYHLLADISEDIKIAFNIVITDNGVVKLSYIDYEGEYVQNNFIPTEINYD